MTKYGIKDNPTRYSGQWKCQTCGTTGQHRDALVYAAEHARETGHETFANSSATVRYIPAPIKQAVASRGKTGKVQIKDRPISAEEATLLRSVTANPGTWWKEFVLITGMPEYDVRRAMNLLIKRGLIRRERVSASHGIAVELYPASPATRS